MKRNNFIFLVAIFFGLKIIMLFTGAIAFSQLPYSQEGYKNNFHFPENEPKYITAFKTWDAQHYLFLSEAGYQKDQESNRFFPLYPLLINIISRIGLSNLLSSYLLSSFFSFGCIFLLFSLTKKIFADESIAFSSVFLFLAFPSAFFLSLPYTESLFIFLSLLFFYLLEKNKKLASFAASFLMPLTRPTGIFIEVPIFFFALYQKKKKLQIPTFNRKISFAFPASLFGLLFPLAGIIVYFLIMAYFLGDISIGIKGLNSQSSWNIANVFDPFSLLKNLVSPPYILHSFQKSVLDRIFFIFFLGMLPLVWKKLPRHYFYYTLVTGMVPIFGSFTSYTRYLLPAFPIFMALSFYLRGKLGNFYYLTLFMFLFLQALLFVMHILNYWAA